MRVQLTRDIQSLGKKGLVRTVDAASGRTLILLGMAKAFVETPKPAEAPKPVEPVPAPKLKRTYKRKDLVAEESAEEPVAAVEKPEPPAETLPQDDDDAPAVRD